MPENRSQVTLSLVAAFFLVGMVGFSLGAVVVVLKVWPFSDLREIYYVSRALWETGDVAAHRFRRRAPANRPRDEFTVHLPASQLDGYYAFTGYDRAAGTYTVRLFDQDGTLINRIAATPADFGVSPQPNFPDPHGVVMLPDGSVVLVFDRADMIVRLDRCGAPVWSRDDAYHHLASRTGRGTILVWRGVPNAYGTHQFIEELSEETGETLRVISIEDVMKMAGPDAAFFNTDPEAPFPDPTKIGFPDRPPIDRYHPNDVEELSQRDADAFPMFDAGDLLVSLKSVNMVAVIDPLSLELKWFQRGPWSKQHDPDYLPDGRISVYDNNTGFGTSRIVIIDPVTGEVETRFAGPEAGDGSFSFRNGSQGLHQRLPNGNILISSVHQGFAAELSEAGNVVMEFHNFHQSDEPWNAHMSNALWLPEDFFAVSPVCETGVTQ